MSGGAPALIVDPVLRAWIDVTAVLYRIPSWQYRGTYMPGGVLLEALMLSENSLKMSGVRYEPHLDRLSDGDTPRFDDGMREDDKSYGPMQVLGLNVEKLMSAGQGCTLDFSVLNDWLVGVGFGLKILLPLLQTNRGNVEVALARYNGGGSGNPGTDGKLRNQAYVDRIYSRGQMIIASRRASNGNGDAAGGAGGGGVRG